MFDYLLIDSPRERWLVGAADLVLKGLTLPDRLARVPGSQQDPRRILVLRLERMGDLIMTLGAFAALRRYAPQAEIDLVVGSWNEPLARAIPGIDRIETMDAGWLARGAGGRGLGALARQARRWRARRYDLAVNFEGDIRSNVLLRLSAARRRAGFLTGGGGDLLTDAVVFDPREHVSTNAERLVARVFEKSATDEAGGSCHGLGGASSPMRTDGATHRLAIPDGARVRAAALLADTPALADPTGSRAAGCPLVGIHPSGGRAIKAWHPDRFAEVANALMRETRARIVLTGTEDERGLVDRVKGQLTGDVIDLAGRLDPLALAAVLQQLNLFICSDSGPMHLAAAVGTPLVAIFGPSDPRRWGPSPQTGPALRTTHQQPTMNDASRVIRIDLPCSPCNRIRQPPARCVGHVPDCLDGIGVERVVAAARELLAISYCHDAR